jgi:hypothetical protein
VALRIIFVVFSVALAFVVLTTAVTTARNPSNAHQIAGELHQMGGRYRIVRQAVTGRSGVPAADARLRRRGLVTDDTLPASWSHRRCSVAEFVPWVGRSAQIFLLRIFSVRLTSTTT